MSLAATATNPTPRRRPRSAADLTLGVDSRHRRSAARRKPQEPLENPAMHYGWPDGCVQAGISAVMLAITALHHQALLDALFSLLPL